MLNNDIEKYGRFKKIYLRGGNRIFIETDKVNIQIVFKRENNSKIENNLYLSKNIEKLRNSIESKPTYFLGLFGMKEEYSKKNKEFIEITPLALALKLENNNGWCKIYNLHVNFVREEILNYGINSSNSLMGDMNGAYLCKIKITYPGNTNLPN